jgi:hypothetical protein
LRAAAVIQLRGGRKKHQEHDLDRASIDRRKVDGFLEPSQQSKRLLDFAQTGVRDRDILFRRLLGERAIQTTHTFHLCERASGPLEFICPDRDLTRLEHAREEFEHMVLIATTPGASANESKQWERSNRPHRPSQPSLARHQPGIFEPLVVSRMHRAEIEIEQLMRERALKK